MQTTLSLCKNRLVFICFHQRLVIELKVWYQLISATGQVDKLGTIRLVDH